MKAGILFTGTGPILIVTSYDALDAPGLREKLGAKGIQKYIAYEVSPDQVRELYGNHYGVVMEDLAQDDDLRVMDYNGHRVFANFSLKDLGQPVVCEA